MFILCIVLCIVLLKNGNENGKNESIRWVKKNRRKHIKMRAESEENSKENENSNGDDSNPEPELTEQSRAN